MLLVFFHMYYHIALYYVQYVYKEIEYIFKLCIQSNNFIYHSYLKSIHYEV